MYTFDPVWIRENSLKKFKPVHPVCVFNAIKGVCCTIIPHWKDSSSKKSVKAPNYHEMFAHDKQM